jgi:hypothetical protein
MRAAPPSFVFHFPSCAFPRKRIKNGPYSKYGPFLFYSAVFAACAARFVVFIFHDTNFSMKFRQWVAILFFGKAKF